MSDSLWPNGLQNTRLPCPSPSPRDYSNSCPLSQWCHPTIIFCHPLLLLQSFPASGSFPVSWFCTSGGQRIGASASASILAVNIQDWFPLGWTGWISLQSKGLTRVFSSTTVQSTTDSPRETRTNATNGVASNSRTLLSHTLKFRSSEWRCCQGLSLNPAGDPPRLPQLPLAASSLGIPQCACSCGTSISASSHYKIFALCIFKLSSPCV